jgi:CDP-2,3-bis-(O-geranylgeranyl)-sn-glycerol synthase
MPFNLNNLILTIKFLLPMWTANVALNFFHFYKRRSGFWDYTLDLGKKFFDGRRILGDAKTVLGLPMAIFFGFLGGWILSQPKIGVFMGLFTYLGALLSGFLKRRLGIKRGGCLPIIDQTDYLIVGSIGLRLLGYRVDSTLFLTAFFVTLIVHTSANIVGFRLGIKDNPW